MKNWSLIACGAVLVTACGGGGGDDPPPVANVPGSEVPLAATQDPDAAFAFVSSVAAASSDTAEALRVGEATLATTETDDPKPL